MYCYHSAIIVVLSNVLLSNVVIIIVNVMYCYGGSSLSLSIVVSGIVDLPSYHCYLVVVVIIVPSCSVIVIVDGGCSGGVICS